MNSTIGLDVSKFIRNCLPSPNMERDWDLLAAGITRVFDPKSSFPPDKDLREDWWKVGYQDCTGSCVGWATADGVLRWHFVKAGRLAPDEPLSVRYIWMAAKEMDNYTKRPTSFIEIDGTSLKTALDIARKYGVVTNSVLPFEFPPGSLVLYTTGNENAFYILAAKLRISGYFNLGGNLDEWRSWIANKGPVLVRLDVDTSWDNATASHGNLDVYYPPDKTQPTGHCVALVGYTPDRFIVRNSWGTNWGDNGFGYASNDYASKAITEAYGVVL